jgi:hypothetical protein
MKRKLKMKLSNSMDVIVEKNIKYQHLLLKYFYLKVV